MFTDLSHHRTCRSAYGGSYFGCHACVSVPHGVPAVLEKVVSALEGAVEISFAERLGFVPAAPLERSEKNPLSKAEKATLSVAFFAERLGFEPRVPVRVRRISSAVHSTTLASLRCFCGCKDTKVNWKFKEKRGFFTKNLYNLAEVSEAKVEGNYTANSF